MSILDAVADLRAREAEDTADSDVREVDTAVLWSVLRWDLRGGGN